MKSAIAMSAALLLCSCSTVDRVQPTVASGRPVTALKTLPATTDDLKVIEDFAGQLPLERTLVVFDIDDTLLTTEIGSDNMNSFYGSDRWFVWQEGEASGESKVGSCLIDLVEQNYRIIPMQATQSDAPAILARIPNDKLIITSRGPKNWESTLRELNRANFKQLHPTVQIDPEDFTHTQDDRTDQVSYRDGVMMTSGFNKGVMLLEMLDRSERSYDHVILVDDTQKHLTRMKVAVESRGMKFYGSRYTRIKDGEALPKVTDQQAASHARGYSAILQLLAEGSPESSKRFKDGCNKEVARIQQLSL